MEFMLPLDIYKERYRYKYEALYHALRDAIIGGTLPGNTKLPSSRRLAAQYGMSRGAVAVAYDMLLADGYVYAHVGRGTFVTSSGPAVQALSPGADIVLSPWANRLLQLESDQANLDTDLIRQPGNAHREGRQDIISFVPQGMRTDHFPHAEWKNALSAAARDRAITEREGLAGCAELRESIASHLRMTRGIQADAGQIVLFNGSLQGIVLIMQLLITAKDTVVMEPLSYPGIRHAVHSCGGTVLPANMDRQGVIPADWDARMVFVTPARQFPTGAVLSLPRRKELLSWATRRGGVIIEDDYDSEFRWGGRPIEPLKALDVEERVIYIGSFSKTMHKEFRLGYAVLPRSLVYPLLRVKALYEPLPAGLLEQRALARFMTRGGYARHLRRMTRIYGMRHQQFCYAIQRHADGLFGLEPDDAGLHIYAKWKHTQAAYDSFRAACIEQGVVFRDVERYRLVDVPPAVCFGFAHLDEAEIEEGCRRLAAAWMQVQHVIDAEKP